MKRYKKQSRVDRERREPREPRGRTFYWIVAYDQGKTIVLAGDYDQATAERKGYEQLDCQFELVGLDTVDITRASRILKARKLAETHDLRESLERMKHQV